MATKSSHHSNRYANQSYNKALYIVQNLPASSHIQPTKEQKLQLYALYKQASQGDVDSQRPGIFDIVGRAKWDAWKKLQGMSEMEAKYCYVQVLLDVAKEALQSPAGRTQAQQIIQSFSTMPLTDNSSEDESDDQSTTDAEEMAYLEQVRKSQSPAMYRYGRQRLERSSSRASSQTMMTAPTELRRLSQSSTHYRRPISAASVRPIRFEEPLDESVNPWTLQPSVRHYLPFDSQQESSRSIIQQEQAAVKKVLGQLQQQLDALSDRIDSLKRELIDRQAVNRLQKRDSTSSVSDEDGWRWVFKAAVKHAFMNLTTVFILLLVLHKNQSPVAQAVFGLIQSFWQRLK
ncbi:acyl CoA binding protein-domain-containing protein [Choanephora cucurbitarum]|nr:acyl CoA binding protein-domain-containing protein [Choanephora cucurbitarum]